MPLRDAGAHASHDAGRYSFEALAVERRLAVFVTDRAVKLIRPAGSRASRARFDAYRERFVQAASRKYELGEVLENGDVLVDASDVAGPAIADS